MYQLIIRNGGVFSYVEYSKFDEEIRNEYDNVATLIYELDEIDFKNREINNMTHVVKGSIVNILDFWSRFDDNVDLNTDESDNEEEISTITQEHMEFVDKYDWNQNIDILNDILINGILFDKRDWIFVIIFGLIFSFVNSCFNDFIFKNTD